MAVKRWSTISGRERSRTSCWRLSVRGRPATPIAQSGCAANSWLFALTISGSIHSPKRMPRSSIRRARPSIPLGSLRRSTTQSPSEVVSSSRAPNQPSSRTNSSIPRSRATVAMSTSFCSSKSKYVPSQLLIRTGRGRSRQAPRASRSRYSPWYAALRPSRPAADQARTASGVREVLARLERPGKAFGVDPEPGAGRAVQADLGLGQEVAGVDEADAVRLAARLGRRRAAQDQRRIVLVTAGPAQARGRLATGARGRVGDVPLTRPGTAQLDEHPVVVGQVERGAHRGGDPDAGGAAVPDPDVAGHDRRVAEDRVREGDLDAARADRRARSRRWSPRRPTRRTSTAGRRSLPCRRRSDGSRTRGAGRSSRRPARRPGPASGSRRRPWSGIRGRSDRRAGS